jgi:hypothetical protein
MLFVLSIIPAVGMLMFVILPLTERHMDRAIGAKGARRDRADSQRPSPRIRQPLTPESRPPAVKQGPDPRGGRAGPVAA